MRFAEAVRRVVDEAHPLTPSSLTVLSERDLASMPTPAYAVEALIPEGVTLLAAPPGVGKTTFAIALAIAKATARDLGSEGRQSGWDSRWQDSRGFNDS